MKDANSKRNKTNSGESWLREKWRPLMAVQYMVVCIMDFVILPVVWSGLQVHMHQPMVQWEPLTLKSTGLYHVAMGAVCGVSAWTRGQEKNIIAQQGKYSEPPPTQQ